MIYPQLNLPHVTIRLLLDAYEQQDENYFLCNFITKNKHGLHLYETNEIYEALKEACPHGTPLETVVDETNNLTVEQRDELYRMDHQLRIKWLHHELKRTAP